MIDHQDLQLALRTQALTLSVATCSGVNLSVAGAIYTRASGSFLTDGFSIGMEVLGAGFNEPTNNTSNTIIDLAATTLTVDVELETEATLPDRTLTVGLPQGRAWENIKFEPTTGDPWVEEQLIPGPTRQITVGPLGTLETRLLYRLEVHTVEGKGIGAANRYADKLLTLFTPRTSITFGSETARVRTDVGPYRGQLLRRRPGFATVPVTVPLEIRSANTV